MTAFLDYARKMRQPALIFVLAVIAVLAAISAGYFVIGVRAGSSLASAAQLAGSASAGLVWYFIATALVVVCLVLQPRPKAIRLVLGATAVVLWVGVGFSLLLWLLGLIGIPSIGSMLGALGGLVETLGKAACAYLVTAIRSMIVRETASGKDAEPAGDQQAGPGSEPEAEPEGIAPVWKPEEAVGLHWRRAGDAATGAQGSGVSEVNAISPQAEPAALPASPAAQARPRVEVPAEAPDQASTNQATATDPAEPGSVPPGSANGRGWKTAAEFAAEFNDQHRP